MGCLIAGCCLPGLQAVPPRTDREDELVDVLLSSQVQVPLPKEVQAQPDRLAPDKIIEVFARHVPDVHTMRYRGKSGGNTPITTFLSSTYQIGFTAPEFAPLNLHFTNLFRLIVHYGERNGPKSAMYLREVAEAFQDCQAMQARAIERVGMLIEGTTADFKGLLTRLVGEYKEMAVKVYAIETVRTKSMKVDAVHYSYRITADLGTDLGLNKDDVRRAEIDEISQRRCPRLSESERMDAASRVRELFELDGLLSALVAEVGNFGEGTAENSLARKFIDWSAKRLDPPHVVLDEETYTRGEIDLGLAMAVFEDIFLGQPQVSTRESYKGVPLHQLFNCPPVCDSDADETSCEESDIDG